VLMVIGHSPPHRPGFHGSIVQIGFPLGLAMGTVSFFALARLDDAQFTSWGWRQPFLASAVLVIVGTFMILEGAPRSCVLSDAASGRIMLLRGNFQQSQGRAATDCADRTARS
jgi:MFS family permease